MQLHTVPGAPNARKTLAVVRHLNLEINILEQDFFAKDMQQEDYLAINPNAKTPVLVDGEFALWESEAINTYLCQITPKQNLLPEDLRDQADVRRWQFWACSHYNRWLGTIAWEHVIKPQILGIHEIDEYLAKDAKPFFERFARVLNSHLEGRQVMVGNHWTLADYSLALFEPFALEDSMPIDWTRYENIQRFYHHLRQNEYWMSTAVAAGKVGRTSG